METETPPTLRLLSQGAGVQTTALSILYATGELPPIDGAIFADTGWEPRKVYAHLDRLEREVLRPAGIPLYRVRAGNIRRDALNPAKRFASMPLFVRQFRAERVPVRWGPCACGWVEWLALGGEANGDVTLDGTVVTEPGDCETCDNTGRAPVEWLDRTRESMGMGRRQCTNEYKLVPIKRKVRDLLGYPHPARIPAGMCVDMAVGISTDEVLRAKDSTVGYIKNTHPLLDLGMTRADCTALLEAHGFGETPKSACIGCPFHGNSQWRDLRDNDPDEWEDAVAFDYAIREGGAESAKGSEYRSNLYLHASGRPLDLAPIDRPTRKERAAAQGDLLELAAREDNPNSCGPFACRGGDMDALLDVVDLGMPLPA